MDRIYEIGVERLLQKHTQDIWKWVFQFFFPLPRETLSKSAQMFALIVFVCRKKKKISKILANISKDILAVIPAAIDDP